MYYEKFWKSMHLHFREFINSASTLGGLSKSPCIHGEKTFYLNKTEPYKEKCSDALLHVMRQLQPHLSSILLRYLKFASWCTKFYSYVSRHFCFMVVTPLATSNA